MAGSGPPPNPGSRRQTGSQAHTWLDLPAVNDGETPPWPLPPLVSDKVDLELFADRESRVWGDIWRAPQAFAWSRNGWTHDVALYVRYFVLGEGGNLDAAKEARMWSDRLGLNPKAMLSNRWRVRGDELAEKRETKKPAQKRRLVVADGAVAGS